MTRLVFDRFVLHDPCRRATICLLVGTSTKGLYFRKIKKTLALLSLCAFVVDRALPITLFTSFVAGLTM